MQGNPPLPYPAPYAPRSPRWLWIVGGVVAVGAVAGGVWYFRRTARDDVWLYTSVAKIPGAGPWVAWVSHKGAPNTPTPPQGWKFQALGDLFMTSEAAEETAQRYIREQGGTPELFK